GFAVLLEREARRGDGEALLAGGHARKTLALPDGVGEFRRAEIGESGLPVEEVHLGRRAGLEEVDDSFCFCWKVRLLQDAAGRVGFVLAQKRRKGRRAESCRAASEEAASGKVLDVGVHSLGGCSRQALKIPLGGLRPSPEWSGRATWKSGRLRLL